MENLTASGAQLKNLFDTVDARQVEATLGLLAKWHARFYGDPYRFWDEKLRAPFIELLVMETFKNVRKE